MGAAIAHPRGQRLSWLAGGGQPRVARAWLGWQGTPFTHPQAADAALHCKPSSVTPAEVVAAAKVCADIGSSLLFLPSWRLVPGRYLCKRLIVSVGVMPGSHMVYQMLQAQSAVERASQESVGSLLAEAQRVRSAAASLRPGSSSQASPALSRSLLPVSPQSSHPRRKALSDLPPSNPVPLMCLQQALTVHQI